MCLSRSVSHPPGEQEEGMFNTVLHPTQGSRKGMFNTVLSHPGEQEGDLNNCSPYPRGAGGEE